jgi:hypothetical protein
MVFLSLQRPFIEIHIDRNTQLRSSERVLHGNNISNFGSSVQKLNWIVHKATSAARLVARDLTQL